MYVCVCLLTHNPVSLHSDTKNCVGLFYMSRCDDWVKLNLGHNLCQTVQV